MTGIREERKQNIIYAAMEVFGREGYHRAKIEEIAEVAEIGKSTVYEYFDSKKDLFEEMIRFIAVQYKNDVKKALISGNGCKERLLAFARKQASFFRSHMELAETTMTESNSVSDEIKNEMMEMKKEILALIEDVLKCGVESGELRDDLDTRTSTAIILGAINEDYAMQAIIDNKKPEDVDPEPVIDLILQGMGRAINNEQRTI